MGDRVPASFREAAERELADLVLRPELDADLDFLRELYASTRTDELAPVPWTPAQKRAFLDSQFDLQRTQYRQHYAGAEWLVIERGHTPIGRIYVHRGGEGVRLMEIALLPGARGAGTGARIIRVLLDWADAQALPVSLHVEAFNPVYRLYLRQGFGFVRDTGVYHFLERPVGAGEGAGAEN